MKVEMFWVNDALVEVEQIINEWLLENQDIEIKHILQSAALISIWYDESSKDDLLVSQEKLWIELQDCGVSKPVFDSIIKVARAKG